MSGWTNSTLTPNGQAGGLGSQLVQLAKELRPAGLELWTFQTNVGARRFYESHGFVATAMTDGTNEERAPDVRYHWPSAELPIGVPVSRA